MSERLDAPRFQPIARLQESDDSPLPGYDSLQQNRLRGQGPELFDNFSLNPAYNAYLKMHKVYVGKKGGRELIGIANDLKDEWIPNYLQAGGWAAAEAGLVCDDLDVSSRMELMNTAEDCWQRALAHQSDLNESREKPWLIDDSVEFRTALNLAFTPLMKSIVAGDVTKQTREKAFVDTIAIAQTAAVQHRLAAMTNNPRNQGVMGTHIGFAHECNAYLAFLYINDPHFVPIPSTFRAGTGYTYKSQTHDLTLVNQDWGDIQNIIPVEIKANARMKDRRRYQALIIRGKMHLTLPGDRSPFDTTEAFAAMYNGSPTERQERIVQHTTSTVHDLLGLYLKGECPEEFKRINSSTEFHTKDYVVERYPELRAS